MKKRGFIVGDYLTWWILAIVALVTTLIIYGIISGKGTEALEYFQQILRYGR
ncbi:MAG: hypothetical protein KC506_00535 [Nanoarchaeota archaeon]|nr:hypothetical protein [Nanoarchaeota archaeon]